MWCGNPESRLAHLQNSEFTRIDKHSRAARCFRIIEFSCVFQGVYLVLQVLNLSQQLIHGGRILLHRDFINFQHGKFSVILQFRSNLLRDFLDDLQLPRGATSSGTPQIERQRWRLGRYIPLHAGSGLAGGYTNHSQQAGTGNLSPSKLRASMEWGCSQQVGTEPHHQWVGSVLNIGWPFPASWYWASP